MKKSLRRPANEKHLLYGVNPIVEALRAKRLPEQITIAEGTRDERLRELIELARQRNVPVRHARRIDLDREIGNSNHQGVIARIAAPEYADADDLLATMAG